MNIKKIEFELLERMMAMSNYSNNPCFIDLYRFTIDGGGVIDYLNKNLADIKLKCSAKNSNDNENYKICQDFRNVLHGLIYQVYTCCYRNNISRCMILQNNGIDVYGSGRNETKIKTIEYLLNALGNVDMYYELNNSMDINCPSHKAKKKNNKI